MTITYTITHVCPACADMHCFAPGECDDCGSKLLPAPALPPEVWATPRTGIDYLGAARVLCGGSSFQHTEKTA